MRSKEIPDEIRGVAEEEKQRTKPALTYSSEVTKVWVVFN